MIPRNLYATWVEIDLGALASNVRWLINATQTSVMAVVKANAYGHGAVQAARAAVQGGAAWLGVARLEEALQLRDAGVETPILVMGYTPAARMGEAVHQKISLTVWDPAQIEAAASQASMTGDIARVHLKVDTGMNRLGVQLSQACSLAQAAASTPGVLLEGIFTHFARADEHEQAPTDRQEALFNELLDSLDALGVRTSWIHAYNSAASLWRKANRFNLLRPGISIYGLHPSDECHLPDAFHPVLSWKAVLSHVKTLPPGRGLSYGHEYVTSRTERIGTIPVGYADGFHRSQPNEVLIAGKRVPIVARVCMDQVMVQLDSIPGAVSGDEVVIIGEQGDQKITAEQVGNRWGTINYDVVCGINARVVRVYR
jgi:alanine racemase